MNKISRYSWYAVWKKIVSVLTLYAIFLVLLDALGAGRGLGGEISLHCVVAEKERVNEHVS